MRRLLQVFSLPIGLHIYYLFYVYRERLDYCLALLENDIDCITARNAGYVTLIEMSPERRSPYEISLDEIIFNAKEIMLRDGNHVPALIVEGEKKLIVTQISDFPETHGERMALLRFLGQAAVKTGVIGKLQQVFIITEGWLSLGSEEKSSGMRPSQDPDRTEVLVISGMQIKERKKYMRLFEILRGSDQHVVRLEEFSADEKKGDKLVEIPLVEAFVEGFKMAFRTKYN